MKATAVYIQMDGTVTKRYYTALQQIGGIAGVLAVNLFRAQKCSARAKTYRKRAHTTESYARKEWSMANLCDVLAKHGNALGIRYGWKEDPNVIFEDQASFVLYVDLPTGQVSFHNPRRGNGPDYPGMWDQSKRSQERIIEFCDQVYSREWPTHAEAYGTSIYDHRSTAHQEKLWPDDPGRE